MKIIIATLLAGLAVAPARAATGEAGINGAGHWAWISEPVIGAKSSPATHRRIWIPDHPAKAVGVGPGHWQWVTEMSIGPRAGAPIRRRIWVAAE